MRAAMFVAREMEAVGFAFAFVRAVVVAAGSCDLGEWESVAGETDVSGAGEVEVEAWWMVPGAWRLA